MTFAALAVTSTLFAPPIYLPAVVLLVGVIVLFVGLRAGQRPVWLGGGGLAVLAVGWFGLAAVVETGREAALARTSAIVDAAEDGRWADFGALLDPITSLPGFYADGAEFAAGAERSVERAGVTSAAVTSTQVDESVPGAVIVDATVLSQQEITMGRPFKSGWRFRYVRTDDALVLERVEVIPVTGGNVQSVQANIR